MRKSGMKGFDKKKYYIITTAKYSFHCQLSPFPLVFGTKGNTAA
jgi:hypothetical protein